MSSETGDPDEVERLLRNALRARASAVMAEPDVPDLRQRIDRASDRVERRGRLVLGAAVLLVAAAIGGGVGAFVVPLRTEHALLSGNAANQAGSLPTGPAPGRNGPAARGVRGSSEAPQPALYIARTTTAGTRLVARGVWLNPVAVVSGSLLDGCYAHELVTTTATKGTSVGAATGVVGLQPLAATGLEVVDSGAVPAPGGADVWWATVAVGSQVARVAAEEPDGATDAMRPENGIAVLGGLTPKAVTSGYFSVVAEDASGQSLHSIGFLTGRGPTVIGTAPVYDVPEKATSGCTAQASADQNATTLGSQPAAPLLATESVVSAFQQAYTFDSPTGLTGSLAAVESGASLRAVTVTPPSSRSGGAPGSAAPGAPLETHAEGAIEVARVTFLSAEQADVAYRIGNGPWRTGAAVATDSGLWQVTQRTFCASLLSGLPASGQIPPALLVACQKISG